MFGFNGNAKRRELERDESCELNYLSDEDIDLIYSHKHDNKLKKLKEDAISKKTHEEDYKYDYIRAIEVFDKYASKIYKQIKGGDTFNQKSEALKKDLFGFFGFLGGGYSEREKIESYFFIMSRVLDNDVFSFSNVKINLRKDFFTGYYSSYLLPLVDVTNHIVLKFKQLRQIKYNEDKTKKARELRQALGEMEQREKNNRRKKEEIEENDRRKREEIKKALHQYNKNIRTLVVLEGKNKQLAEDVEGLKHIVSNLSIFDDDFLDMQPQVLQYINDAITQGRV